MVQGVVFWLGPAIRKCHESHFTSGEWGFSVGLFAGPVSLEALGVATFSEASQEAFGGVRNQIQLQAIPQMLLLSQTFR